MSSAAIGGPEAPSATVDTEPSEGSRSEPGDRGRLQVADRVVEKVAGHAVTLVPDASAAPRRVLGVNVGDARDERRAHVDVQVQGDIATAEVMIAVRWPRPAPLVAASVRQRIRDEVARVTGIRVEHVDVEVTSMSIPGPEMARVQ